MANNRTIACAIFILVIVSCKREKLSNDYSYLYGKWYWLHTYKNLGQPGFEDITPSSDGNNYSIEVSKKCVIFFKNEKEEKRRRYKEIDILPGATDTSKIVFLLHMNKDDGLIIDYYPSRNYIMILGFPYESPDGSGTTYENYFKK